MQSISPVTTDQLLARGQKPLARLEIYNNASWINLCNLFSPIDLVGWWAFDEGAEMTAYDHSKYGNHGSLENMEEEDHVDGKVGKALEFDGGVTNEYVSIPDTANLRFGTGDFSIGAWIKAGVDVTVHRGIYAKGSGAAEGTFAFYLVVDTGRLRFLSGGIAILDGTKALNDNVWHYIEVIRSGDSLSFYIDSVLDATTAEGMAGVDLSTTAITTIGWRGGAYFFLGLIDEVRIYKRALTATEIKALYDLKGKNYLESVSVSLGGASMTPSPVGGAFSAVLSNKDSIFHPKHPTSAYTDWLKTGRKARISIGAKYGGTAYYWQRVVGFMDEPKFSAPDYKVSISGADHMKFLADAQLRNLDNFWGSSQTFDSIDSDGLLGSELYNEADAMDITGEANNVDNWIPYNCTFVSESDAGGGSEYVGKAVMTDVEIRPDIISGNLFTPEANTEYILKFKYKAVSGGGTMSLFIWQAGVAKIGQIENLETSAAYKEETVYFKTLGGTEAIRIYLQFFDAEVGTQFRVDQFSIFKFIPYWERYYELPGACKGPHRVVLDGEDVWQGEGDEDWEYEESTRRVFFNINKEVANGTNNLVIHYFTAEPPENVVADILVKVGLYADRAAALADMDYTATGITLDRIWFKAGSTCLNAIKKLCERCDYRFYFKYDGKPVFKPKPTPGTTAFTFTDPGHIASALIFQDRNEIRNRIVIKGEKQADPGGKEETMPPELKGEAHDQDSIDEYGEKTKAIENHLFQDQTSIDNMCASMLTEYKDPKWYADLEVPFNPVPLELGDKISWKERLSPVLGITQTGMTRDIKINNFNSIYRNEI